nr:MFS transporter [Sulfobacillus harzensis]
MTREQTFWLFLAALAWLIESYDIGLTSVILLPFKTLFHLTADARGLLVIAPTIGIVLGVVPSGMAADLLGRKTLFAWAMLWYSVWTVLAGFSSSWRVLALMRMAAGLGLGAMFPMPYTLLAELSPAKIRGRIAGILDAFLSLGYFAAPLAGAVIARHVGLNTGWRLLFFAGGIGIVYAGLLAVWLPESPRWLLANGRAEEAKTILARIGQPLASHPLSHPAYRFSAAFQGVYRQRTAMLWVAFPSILFLFYAIMNFMPSVLSTEHLTDEAALNFSAYIMAASIPGKLFEAWLVEQVGRKTLIVGFAAAASLAALIFPLVHGPLPLLLLGMALAFFGIAVDPAMKIYAAEQYPTTFRATGVGMAEGVARLFGGALAPYIFSFLLAMWGVPGSFAFVALVGFAGAVAVGLWGQETRGLPLPDFPIPTTKLKRRNRLP